MKACLEFRIKSVERKFGEETPSTKTMKEVINKIDDELSIFLGNDPARGFVSNFKNKHENKTDREFIDYLEK